MRVISGQNYINEAVKNGYKEMIKLELLGEYLQLPVLKTELSNDEGEELYALVDGHHRLQAARELGFKVRFYEENNEIGLIGEDLLKTLQNDSDWYYVDTDKYVWA